MLCHRSSELVNPSIGRKRGRPVQLADVRVYLNYFVVNPIGRSKELTFWERETRSEGHCCGSNPSGLLVGSYVKLGNSLCQS